MQTENRNIYLSRNKTKKIENVSIEIETIEIDRDFSLSVSSFCCHFNWTGLEEFSFIEDSQQRWTNWCRHDLGWNFDDAMDFLLLIGIFLIEFEKTVGLIASQPTLNRFDLEDGHPNHQLWRKMTDTTRAVTHDQWVVRIFFYLFENKKESKKPVV